MHPFASQLRSAVFAVLIASSAVALVAPLALAQANHPATKPAGRQPKPVEPKPVEPKQVDLVADAIKTLTAEYQDAIKKNSSLPRTKPDYFDNVAAKPPIESVLRALSQRVAQNAQADAYVRLQLVSALPHTIEGALGEEAARLLAVGPELLTVPGSTQPERRDLDKIAQRTKMQDITNVMSQWQTHVQDVEKRNQNAIDYRTELFKRLPVSRNKIDASLEDLRQRVQAGIQSRDYFRAIGSDVRVWAQQSARPAELRQVAQTIKMMSDQLKTTVYETLEFNDQQRRATWRSREVRIDGNASKDLVEFLNARSRGE